MSEPQIVLLPKADYWTWVQAARDYVIKFGVNVTADPDAAARYQMPQQTVTIVDTPNGYPAQGEIRAWFARSYPSIKTDFVPAKTPDELQAALNKRIAANDRFLPVAPPAFDFRRIWAAGKCLTGLHGRADGRMQEPDFAVVQQTRMEAVKLTSSANPEDVIRLRQINPNVFIMVRLFASFAGRVVDAGDFATWLTYDMGQFYQRGVRYFEIHNEPNLVGEGWTLSWKNGREFGQWWLSVRNRLKTLYPEAKFGWPGLSPDGFPMPERTNDVRFLDEAAEALRVADFICLHSYWRDEAEMLSPNGGMNWQMYRQRYPDKLLFISEFSNPMAHVPTRTKGEQYVRYYQQLRGVPGLGAAFAFIVSASANFPHEAWRLEDGHVSEIATVVAGRPMA